MLPLTINRVIQCSTQYVRQAGSSVDLILVGGVVLQAYGFTERVRVDGDGELIGELNSLVTFLQEHGVLADLGENMSGWMDKEFWNQLAKKRIQA